MRKNEGMTKSKVRNAHSESVLWCDDAESIVREQPEANRVYDFQARTARFGKANHRFRKDNSPKRDSHLVDQSACWGRNKFWCQLIAKVMMSSVRANF